MLRTSFRLNIHSIVCLNVKELFAWIRRYIGNLSDSNGIWTHNHLARNRTLNHLANWPFWLNGWVFVYELSGCGFESRCCHIKAVGLLVLTVIYVLFIIKEPLTSIFFFRGAARNFMEGGSKFSKTCWPTKKTLGYGTVKSVSFGPFSMRNYVL